VLSPNMKPVGNDTFLNTHYLHIVNAHAPKLLFLVNSIVLTFNQIIQRLGMIWFVCTESAIKSKPINMDFSLISAACFLS